MAIFIRSPALSELITLNCWGLSAGRTLLLFLLLALLVDAEEESESLDESDPSSESDDDEDDDEDESGDLFLSAGLASAELLFKVVILHR
uniref:Putative secreted protein n=1 Tax=Anopheles darlingi TaxID=43151 RepID=A0A2M4DA77_ANODA